MTGRTYRFGPRDGTGVLFGLSGVQVAVLGVAAVGGAFAVSAGAPMPAVGLLLVAAAVACFVAVDGTPLVAAFPHLAGWACRLVTEGRRWCAPVRPAVTDPFGAPPLPPALDGQEIIAVPCIGWPRSSIAGIARDCRSGLLAASVRVSGGGFALADRMEQDRLLALWGDALGAFCTERSSVAAVRWSEWTAPADMEHQAAWVKEQQAPEAEDVLADYEALLDTAATRCVRRETLVTVTIRGPLGRRRERVEDAAADLLAQLRLFAGRLDAAGLVVSDPLSPQELARAVRSRLDPSSVATLDRRGRALGQTIGLVAPVNAGPLCTEARWSHWVVDGSVHRVFWVAEWPRLEVPAGWMGDLLLPGRWTRIVTLWAEPVPPSASRRRIERQSAKLDSDEEHRRRTGFRVGAEHRRARAEVAEREAELVAGYTEFAYAGLVAVAAPDSARLELAADELVQTAAGTGVGLRPLHGRHDAALGACLPLARGLAARRRVA